MTTAATPTTSDTAPEPAAARQRAWWFRAAVYGTAIGLSAAMFQDLPSEAVGGLGVALMLVLLVIKTPVAVAMTLAGCLGITALRGLNPLVGTLRTVPFDTVSSWSLSVLPMFVFMGLMLWRSGATTRLYDAAKSWLSWLPGGLAVSTNFAGAGLGAVSGSTLGVAYALGRIGIPEMLKAGYDRRLATGAVLMAGTGGQLIPPSILLVIYAGVAEVPVGPQLLAGLVPGVLLALVYGVTIIAIAVARPALVGGPRKPDRTASFSWGQRWSTLGRIWPVVALALSVVGGLYGGVFTATEAGAVGAVGALVVGLWMLNLRGFRSALGQALGDTVSTCGAIFFLLIGSFIFNRLIVMSGAARWLTNLIDTLGLSRVVFLLAMVGVYVVLGMFMDPVTMMLVTVPLLIPTLGTMDVSLIWFGVFVVLLGELAIVTPPVGLLTFVVHGMTKDPEVSLGQRITLGDVFQSVLWFLPVSLLLLVALIAFPGLAEWAL